MIDFNKALVAALSAVLPTYHELVLTADSETPCISYMEKNNYVLEHGETIGYSRISYQVKVWALDVATIQKYALEIDNALRPFGFKRTSSGELYDINSAMIQKIMSYEALAKEDY